MGPKEVLVPVGALQAGESYEFALDLPERHVTVRATLCNSLSTEAWPFTLQVVATKELLFVAESEIRNIRHCCHVCSSSHFVQHESGTICYDCTTSLTYARDERDPAA